MNKNLQRIVLLALVTLFYYTGTAQVKIGDNRTTINDASLLELESTTQGFLPPRMTTVQRDAITDAPTGLLIYNTTLNCYEQNLGGATDATEKWLCIASGDTAIDVAALNAAANPGGGTTNVYVPATIPTYSDTDTAAVEFGTGAGQVDTASLDLTTINNTTQEADVNIDARILDGKDHDWYAQDYGSKTYGDPLNIYRGVWTYGSVSWGDRSNTASGIFTTAAGVGNFVSGYSSAAMGGMYNSINTAGSFASGFGNASRNHWNSTFGIQNYNAGYNTMTTGQSNVITGPFSFISGYANNVSAQSAVVGGQSHNVSGFYHGTFGENNVVSGIGNLMTGTANVISANNSSNFNIVGGNSNTAGASAVSWRNLLVGDLNVVNGSNNLIGGGVNAVTTSFSGVVGYNNTVTSQSSITAGQDNTVGGIFNGTVGQGNQVTSSYGLTMGQYSAGVANARIVVGNGSGTSARKNVFTVLQNGATGIAINPAFDLHVTDADGNSSADIVLALPSHSNLSYSKTESDKTNHQTTWGTGYTRMESRAAQSEVWLQSTSGSRAYNIAYQAGQAEVAAVASNNNYVQLFASSGLARMTMLKGGVGIFIEQNGANEFEASVAHRAPAFNVTSDVRLKSNVVNVANALSTVKQLRPVSYNKRDNLQSTDYNLFEYGFVAQEVQNVLPKIVTSDGSSDEILAVNYTALIPVLTKAIQELEAKVNNLETENAELKTANAEIELIKAALLSNGIDIQTAAK